MITPAYVHLMARYNAEMNRRWYAAAAQLTDTERKQDRGAFFGSLHATLNHLVWADRTWMSRFAAWEKPAQTIKQSIGLYDAFDELRAARTDLDARLEAWSETLAQDWLDGDLVWFSGATQKELRRPRAMLVVHMFNHQTHHRGQAHALLTAMGQDTSDTDLPFVL
jgi:uncharacterized damage-inducible protein DinB